MKSNEIQWNPMKPYEIQSSESLHYYPSEPKTNVYYPINIPILKNITSKDLEKSQKLFTYQWIMAKTQQAKEQIRSAYKTIYTFEVRFLEPGKRLFFVRCPLAWGASRAVAAKFSFQRKKGFYRNELRLKKKGFLGYYWRKYAS